MTETLDRLVSPRSIAIVGLSADSSKHGGRVLANLRRMGFAGHVWGVNPATPEIAGIDVYPNLEEGPAAPDLVVSAIPAAGVADVALGSAAIGAAAVVVFASGFAESGAQGQARQDRLSEIAGESGLRVIGPNSGGVIRPSLGLGASFLTCLDRPAAEIRAGPVGLVTQSGGTGSYVHNLAAESGSGLAISISVGNEADFDIADGIEALTQLEEVKAIALVVETIRDGERFVQAVRSAYANGKPLVCCRLGTSRHSEQLLSGHTGALAGSTEVLDGVLDSLGVAIAETPAEMFAVGEVLARTSRPCGVRLGVVTHSGGVAILVADLATRHDLHLPQPTSHLRDLLRPLLNNGSVANPLDMGGIVSGPGRFAEAVDLFAASGEFDLVLAVSTPHPPGHTDERVAGLMELRPPVPVMHLWMAGDQARTGLERLCRAGQPVCEEPRAAIVAVHGLTRWFEVTGAETEAILDAQPVAMHPRTEVDMKALLNDWGLPVVEGRFATDADTAGLIAAELGGELVVKIISPDIPHKTDVGGVIVGVEGASAVRAAYTDVIERVGRLRPEARLDGVLIERRASGVEVFVGMLRDPVFGPMAMMSLGGLAVEGLGTQRLTTLPLTQETASRAVRKVLGLMELINRAGGNPDLVTDGLARLVVEVSRKFTSSSLEGLEMNPVVWTGGGWAIVDASAVSRNAYRQGGHDG